MPAHRTQLFYAEIRGAERHPACQPGSPFIAMEAIDPRPYVGSIPYVEAQTRRVVSYWQTLGIGATQAATRIDLGTTFACIGLRQPARDENRRAIDALVGPDAPETVRGYLRGCLDYTKSVNLPHVGTDGWIGSEFENLCRIADIFAANGFARATIYLNTLAEATLTSWMHGANNPEASAALSQLAGSLRGKARGFPPTVDPVRDWAAWWPVCRKVINTTANRMCRDAGLKGRLVLSESCAIDMPARNSDLRPQPACELAEGQASHCNWTAPGPEHTAACVDAMHRHRMRGEEYWAHFSIRETPVNEVAWRMRFGVPPIGQGAGIVFGDGADDLKALGALADMLRGF